MINRAKITRNICCLLVIILFAVTAPCSADQYRSTGEVALIGGSALSLGLVGRVVKNIEATAETRMGGPLPGEAWLHRLLAGTYHTGRSNFLDNRLGSAISPISHGIILGLVDLTWPQRRSGQDFSQDQLLFISGVITTKGLTDLGKGIFRRPRPLALLDKPESLQEHKPEYLKTSFFSGHTSGAFFSATFLNLRLRSIMRQRFTLDEYRRYRWSAPTVLFGWASFVGWSRLQAYKHHPTDVLVGALAGYLVGELFYSFGLTGTGGDSIHQSEPIMYRISFKF